MGLYLMLVVVSLSVSLWFSCVCVCKKRARSQLNCDKLIFSGLFEVATSSPHKHMLVLKEPLSPQPGTFHTAACHPARVIPALRLHVCVEILVHADLLCCDIL